jgi:hypothetical protein
MTTRRVLEDLFVYGLCQCSSRGSGRAALWRGIVLS